MGIKGILGRIGGKAANQVAKLAALSPQQLESIQTDREHYLSQKPDPSDATAEELTRRLLAAGSVEIYNAYLAQLRQLYVPVESSAEYDACFDASRNIRFFRITKWVVDRSENSLEKLVNVYEVLSDEECNISLVFHRTSETTEVYLAITNTRNANNNVDVENYRVRLEDAIRGNFPGSEWEAGRHAGRLPCLDNNVPYSVAAASNIPTEKSQKFISQTIEKLMDGIVPTDRSKDYILILLATPVRDMENRKLRLAQLYSGLAPYASWQTVFTYDEHRATGSSSTVGINVGASAGIQNGQNQNVTGSRGTTASESSTDTQSTGEAATQSTGTSVTESTGSSETHSSGTSLAQGSSGTSTEGTAHSDSTNENWGLNGGMTVGSRQELQAGFLVHGSVGINEALNVGGSFGRGTGTADTVSESLSRTATRTTANTTGEAVATTAGTAMAETAGRAVSTSVGSAIAQTLGRAVTQTASKTVGAFQGMNLGANFGANFARSSNVTATIGKSEGIHQTFTNYNIKHALENLEAQMKRLEQSAALGMWDFAAYVLSEDQNVANNVAHSYLALTQGAESYLSQPAVNLWRGDMGDDSAAAKEICGYLRELRHPLFGLHPGLMAREPDFLVYPPVVTATASLSGKELAYSLNFPRKSIPGLPVIECAEFGRNVASYDLMMEEKTPLTLGRIFHMHHEERTPVCLSKQSLTSHTFITGSTGSGKSNTVYVLLEEAMEQEIPFMVIEPAKGEYKQVFGGLRGVTVLGTNPAVSRLLRLNPFRFPEKIHILEHLDRLIELFNVCWPMYAAMPAVLKQAAEKAYEACGWDLTRSRNRYDAPFYPTFGDVAEQIRRIIDSSEYDAENKGAYKGSLLTRLQSLTNGINGMIFCCEEIPPEELFDQNVIVDLSRVGASETKALLMGVLILKLQEYRMSGPGQMNAQLRHLTVLEEAHHLLKRTAQESTSENANLQGKSVEMLANAIAEMRTWGEGFLIADQSPGLLDLSVIRNTSTKIIMRLPELEDRKLVGHAAGLNDQQITELAKLPRGVAAVYQNEWIQPVLCKVSKYDGGQPETSLTADPLFEQALRNREILLHDLLCKSRGCRMDRNLRELTELIAGMNLTAGSKISFLLALQKNGRCTLDQICAAVYELCCSRELEQQAEAAESLEEWRDVFLYARDSVLTRLEKEEQDLAVECILREQISRNHKPAEYLETWNRFVRGELR